ncbi:MAG: TIGR02679 family protein [Dokdonella sp.]
MSEMLPDPERLQRLLGGADLSDLRRRLRRRFERGSSTTATFTLSGLSNQERDVLTGLLGLPHRRAGSLRIDGQAIDTALCRAGLADSLRAALEALDGPIVDRMALRNAQQQRWHALITAAAEPRLRVLLGSAAGAKEFKRLARGDEDIAERLIADAQRVLARLPATGVARSQLAADCLGDAHALDRDRALARLVLASACVAECAPEDAAARHGERADVSPHRLPRARDRWATLGVLVNELARPALVLNLPCHSDTPIGRQLAHAHGEPAYLSLRSLLRTRAHWDVDGHVVYVCENPNLVAIAADQLGVRCTALVCTDGMPAAAQRILLQQLRSAGAQLHYHGDFDWPGLRIGQCLMRDFGARPWRFGANDFREAAGATASGRSLSDDDGITVDWDDELVGAMREHGYAIDEEALADRLLIDLIASETGC